MRHNAVQQYVVAGFGLALAVVIALAVLAFSQARQSDLAQDWVAHTQEVMIRLGAAESQLFRAEANQRAYLVELAPAFATQREAAVAELRRQLEAIVRLTADNELQQERAAQMRALVERRVADIHSLQTRLEAGAAPTMKDRLAEGAEARATLSPLFQAMVNEERRLLTLRELDERSRSALASQFFVALTLALALLLAAVFWRLRVDFAARRRAELEGDSERRYDTLHARALTLYNATNERAEVLAGTIALLAESPAWPVLAFYAHEELGGTLRLAAAHGVSADARPLLHPGEGLVGAAANSRTAIYLESFDAADGLRIETGLATLRPASMLLAPVLHQGKLAGVLVLAAASRLSGRDRAFVDRLCSQLGVALNNLRQIEGLNQLARQLRASADEIRRKNEEVENASRMKSEFVANMSHELRTPLNAVIGFSELLRDGLVGVLSDEQKEYIGDIHASGRHLLSLINDVLDLSKVEAGLMTLELAAMLPAELSASGLSVVRERAAARNLQLGALVAPGLGRVWVDPRKTKQIVYNLLANAVKFTPEGGRIDMTLRRVEQHRVSAAQSAHPADDTRIFPPPASHEAWLEIEVADTGIGIEPQALKRLFEPFVQIDSSLSRKFAGSGLGLTMVKRLVELHEGGLMLYSVPGQGSTFTVWLPWRLAAAAQGTAQETAQETAQGDAPATAPAQPADLPPVLIVEDDPNSATLLQLQLQSAGYAVETAASAEAGLEMALTLQPQAIVLDIDLPAMNGWEMLARLKADSATRSIPVVIVSALDECQRGYALGAAQVLLKPASQDELVDALAAARMQADGGGLVMVADEDARLVATICEHLQQAGYTALASYGGQQALDALTHHRPDLIVLDLLMPQVSGFDVLAELHRNPATAAIPVLVLTAKLLSPQDRQALRGRVCRIIEKSDYQPAGLIAEVRRALVRNRQPVT